MLKEVITYEDLNGNEVTDILYFRFSKKEVLAHMPGGENLTPEDLTAMMEKKDVTRMVTTTADFILDAYGEKTEDGRGFVKNEAIRKAFEQSLAFEAIFEKMTTDEKYAQRFIKSVIPNDLAEAMEKLEVSDKPKSVPTLPTPPKPSA